MDLLVHVSAPTTKQDDDRFRAQAAALGTFQARCTHRLSTPRISSPKPNSGPPFNSIEDDTQPQHARLIAANSMKVTSVLMSDGSSANLLSSLEAGLPTSTMDAVSIANAALEIHDLDTQQMFNTQYAAAGIQSQLDGSCSEDDFIIPSTERPSKKRSLLDYAGVEEAESPTRQYNFASEKVTQSLSQSTTQTSSQDRRDSLSAEVQPPTVLADVEIPPAEDDSLTKTHELSPSTRMEQEIQAYKIWQEAPSTRNQHDGIWQEPQELVVSSILPDSYGLSRSNESSKPRDSNSSRAQSGPELGNKSPSKLNSFSSQRSDQLSSVGGIAQAEGNKENHELFGISSAMVGTIGQKDVGTHAPDAKSAERDRDEICRVYYDAMDHEPVVRDFAHFPKTPISYSSTPKGTLKKQAVHKSATRRPWKGMETSAAQKRTPPSAATKHSFTRSSSSNSEKDITSSTNSVRRFPRHIFAKEQIASKPETEARAIPSSPALDPSKERAAAAQRHMLYRRQMHRQLEPFERGFWTFDISTWSGELQLEFLRELRIHVEGGQFGSGSWVDLRFGEDEYPCSGDLYCTVTELGEAWLLLMVLSDRRLGDVDMHWIGWDGEAALTMPGKLGGSTAVRMASTTHSGFLY